MKIAILPENFENKSKLLQIKHPRTNISCPFLVQGSKIYELLEVDKPNRSFLFANQVISNGNILLAAQIHPLLLALPLLIERKSEYRSLDDFFNNTDLKPIDFLIFPYFNLVCQNLSISGYDVWQLSDEKLFSWLLTKITNLTFFLKSQLHYNQIIKEKNFNEIESERYYIETAFDIIRHYIRATLAQQLREKLREIYPMCFQPIVLNVAKPPPVTQNSSNENESTDRKEEETVKFTMRKSPSQTDNRKLSDNKKGGAATGKKKDSGKKKGKEVQIAKNSLESFFLPEKKKS